MSRKTYIGRNASGYSDPTAEIALSKTDVEFKKVRKLMDTIRYICNIGGFEVEGHIVLRDKKTGKVWR